MNPIFILGHQRSGSTLLQRMLNVSNNVRIHGEHGGALHHIAGAYRTLCIDFTDRCNANACASVIESLLTNPANWTATVVGHQTDHVANLCREFVEALANPFSRQGRWGFKEVRYGMNENVVNMLIDLYPNAQIVFTTRNPYEYAVSIKSLGWVKNFQQHIQNWKTQWDSFHASLAKHPERTRHLPCGQPEASYTELFHWLGVEWLPAHHAVLVGPRVGEEHVNLPLTEAEIETIRSITKMEPLAGSDPATSSLPTTRSTN